MVFDNNKAFCIRNLSSLSFPKGWSKELQFIAQKSRVETDHIALLKNV